MPVLSEHVLRATANKLIAAHQEASRSNDWLFFVDELYADDCIYTCEYAGVMTVTANGIEEIKATHYGRDMRVGWEGWSFPYEGVYVGTDNRLVTHWLNRGPGLKPDGSHYQTPGISFITLNSQARICRQFDMFDLAHQMKLCDELEAAGLLSAQLKEQWVIPMKQKLLSQLGRSPMKGEGTAAMPTAEHNKRLTRKFFDAMQRGDAAAIADTYADEGRVVTMGNTLISGSRGKDDIRRFAGGVLDAFPSGLKFTILNMTAEENRVAVEATSEGLHVSGKPYSNHYHFLLTWEHGQLLEMKEYMDTEIVTEVLCAGARPQ